MIMDPWRGTERILCEGLLPYLRETYEDLERAVANADLLVSHAIVLPGVLLAEKTGMPWASAVLAPISMMSIYDPPHATASPWINKLWSFGPLVNRALGSMVRAKTKSWCEPIHAMRRELGLPAGRHPLFEGQHSPDLVLAMFSHVIGEPQKDWPASARQTGFCFFHPSASMPDALRRFLDSGPPPIVFTLGSAAVLAAGEFFVESADAVRRLGCRAVLVAGKESSVAADKNMFVAEYAPYAELFPRAAAVVHQGGIGTTAQCLRAGCPALIVPFAHDQPDNAARVKRIGAGRMMTRGRYRGPRAARELGTLLGGDSYQNHAREIANELALEDGVETACRALMERMA
jgi:UDP:flavonoid glycosyltransferase YjiC (YdhE family)